MPDSTSPRTEPQAIERHECTSAEDLLDRLSPRQPTWEGGAQAWLFRGQSDNWPLKAKAYREDRWFKELGLPLPADPNADEPRWPLDFLRVERLLKMFSRELDKAGLPVPAPSPSIFANPNRSWVDGEPGPEEMPTLALAQHHGLPTPWLDWSLQPRAAAYFACSDLVWNDKGPGTMVVWALRRDFVQRPSTDYPDGRRGYVGRLFLTVESAPRSGNSRLHAQAGLFTWLRGEGAHGETVDSHVAGLAQQVASGTLHVEEGLEPPFMQCLTLDREHARQLLKLLHYEGVTAATVFPDYAGVVQTLRERAWCLGEHPLKPIG